MRFIRADLPGRPEVMVRPENAHFEPAAGRRTILREGNVQIHTMEHILAALAGLGIDNLEIELTTMEAPEPADGSAGPIAHLLRGAGIVEQDRPKRHIKVTKAVSWSEDGVELRAAPYDGLRITFTIDYDHPLIGRQTLSIDITPETFVRDIAPARTFVLERDLELLRKSGWIKGGSLDSAVVVGDRKILNADPLRFPDEFVRHKVLDAIGDVALLGLPLVGRLELHRSGHALNAKLVRAVLRDSKAYEIVEPEAADIELVQQGAPSRFPLFESVKSVA